jgi:aminoglycoside phosphotransferase (APT) family kinase protein
MRQGSPTIDVAVVHRLVADQFPQWKDLPIRPIIPGGWDNRTFRLGEQMLIRMPSAVCYAGQVEKEQHWLPKLAPLLPLRISEPLEMGLPGDGYPWNWSIYRWIEGETVAAVADRIDLNDLAIRLAQFLQALHNIDPTGGPLPGPHNFYRGGTLTTYDAETRQAIEVLKNRIDVRVAIEIWESALETIWIQAPVWIHGDISAGNLIAWQGQINAVIDFGQLGIGDPACDLSIAWTLFSGETQALFRKMLPLDKDTWARGQAWTLWKALIYLANDQENLNFEARRSWRIIDEMIADHKRLD